MKIENFKNLCIVGDIHGEFRYLVNKLKTNDIKDSVIIIAGDFGVGFYKKEYYTQMYKRIEPTLKKLNTIILGIRGNHDDPSYFNETPLDFEFLKTLKDYEIHDILGKKVMCIGGAVSVDKEFRINENKKYKRYGSSRKIWWENEIIDIKTEEEIIEFPGHLDIIISHEAPEQFGPINIKPDNLSVEDYKEILREREYLGKIVKEVKPKKWFFGHYHNSYSGSFMETDYKGLDIQEIIEVKL